MPYGIPDQDANQLPDWFKRYTAARISLYNTPRTFMIAGDSLDSVNTVRNSTNNVFGAQGRVIWGMMRARWPLRYLGNVAVGGLTCEQIFDRIVDQVIPVKPGVCFYGGLWNSLSAGVSKEAVVATIERTAIALMEAGIIPCYLGPHANTSYSSVTRRMEVAWINNQLRSFFDEVGGGFIDGMTPTFASATGLEKTGYTRDGLHLTARGAAAIGNGPIYEWLDSLYPTSQFQSIVDPYGFPYNGLLLGSNATGTNGFTRTTFSAGNGPDGWSADTSNASGTVANPAARADGKPGNLWTMSPTMSALNGFGRFFHIVSWANDRANSQAYSYNSWRKAVPDNGFVYTPKFGAAGTSAASQPTMSVNQFEDTVDGTVTWKGFKQPAVGETWRAEFDVAALALTVGTGLPNGRVVCQDSGGSTLYNTEACFYDTTDANEAHPDFLPPTLLLRTPDFLIPTGTQRLSFEFYMRGANSAQLVGGLQGVRGWRIDG